MQNMHFHSKLAYPNHFHYFDSFNDVKLGKNKKKYEFKKYVKQKIAKRKKHSLVRWDIVKKDFDKIKAKSLKPNEKKEICVNNRVYSFHEEKQGKIRLFPIRGQEILNVDGKSLFDHFNAFITSSKANDFEKILT